MLKFQDRSSVQLENTYCFARTSRNSTNGQSSRAGNCSVLPVASLSADGQTGLTRPCEQRNLRPLRHERRRRVARLHSARGGSQLALLGAQYRADPYWRDYIREKEVHFLYISFPAGGGEEITEAAAGVGAPVLWLVRSWTSRSRVESVECQLRRKVGGR